MFEMTYVMVLVNGEHIWTADTLAEAQAWVAETGTESAAYQEVVHSGDSEALPDMNGTLTITQLTQ